MLRDLTRTRKQLRREIVQHKQRIQKVLEDANVKLASAVSDVFGESGRRILKALSAGQTDARQLAALGDGRLPVARHPGGGVARQGGFAPAPIPNLPAIATRAVAAPATAIPIAAGKARFARLGLIHLDISTFKLVYH